jgi:V/A-type H+-transporting ATPase subunit E
MADNKLQALIETLKQQGVETGEEASREIVEKAKKEAEEILAGARAEGENLVNQAKRDAEKQMKQLRSSMEIAASQFVTDLKRTIEENLLTLPLQKKLRESLSGEDFLKQLIQELVIDYARDPSRNDLLLLVSREKQEQLVDFVLDQVRARCEEKGGERPGITLESGGVDFGFMLGRADGNVRLDFSDEAFLTLFLRFLTPRFRDLFKDIKIGEAA